MTRPTVDHQITVRRRRRRDEAHRWILSSGLLLFICLFLPSVDGCSRPYYPVELLAVPPLAVVTLPYFTGLLLVILSIRGLRHPDGLPVASRLVNPIVGVGVLGLGTILVVGTVEDPAFAAGPLILWFLQVPRLLGLYSTSIPLEARRARAISLVGSTSALWFALWMMDGLDGTHVGLWLSLLASVLIAIAGYVLERNVPEWVPPETARAPIARARLRGQPWWRRGRRRPAPAATGDDSR